MLRLLAIALVAALTTMPVSAQSLLRTDLEEASLSASALTAEISAHASRDLSINAVDRPSRGNVGGLAAALFRVLAAQNTIEMMTSSSPEMDAYLRPPSAGPAAGGSSLFIRARQLYDGATSYSTERYDLEVDPLSMRWRVRINLVPFLNQSD